jgi:hypothetical protein
MIILLNKYPMRYPYFLLSAFALILTVSCSVPVSEDFRKLSLSGEWKIKSTVSESTEGSKLSTAGFTTDKWYDATVPTTVLRALIKDGVYPDPWVGVNNFKIPDVSDEFNKKYDLARFSYLGNGINPWQKPYWFRKEFFLPAGSKGKKLWLNFDGINYRADVWLNGHLIAGHDSMSGMFRRFRYDISGYSLPGEKNCLAVLVYQVDHPGIPDPGVQFKVFGKTRGHATDIFRDETLKFSGGWDCAPVVRDRNMGIYEDVFIEATDAVSVEYPFVKTVLPLPDTNRADITVSTVLKNNSNRRIEGSVDIRISLVNKLEFPTYTKELGGNMADIVLKKNVTLEPEEEKEIKIEPGEFPQLSVKNPFLWWPNGYGKQYLHNLDISFTAGGNVSDSKKLMFGIRDVRNELKKIGPEFARVFYINGQRIFCKGGWLQPDALLNYDRKRIYDEARLLAMANVNMVASEDAPAPPEEVLESYDKYGLMYWETFYQCYRMYPGDVTANNPDDHALALSEAKDIIKRYRNHPSLVIWCAANEVTVAQDIYDPLREMVFGLDGTRPFIPASSTSWDIDKLTPYIKKDLPLGTTDDGDPDYNWNPEKFYFDKILEVKLQTFRNELGVASVPVFSSIKKFIPELSTQTGSEIFPLDSVWAEHGAWDDNNYAFRAYDKAIRTLYGKPSDAEDYVKKAQYVNANSYRAMYEAANHRMWTITSGVMLWKLNDCWPSVLWQLYDWYFCQNSAYYFSRSAMEPLHIQMNANTSTISVISTLPKGPGKIKAEAEILGQDLKKIWVHEDSAVITTDGYTELFSLPSGINTDSIYFVRLKLKNSEWKILSENTYWLSKSEKPDFSSLAGMGSVPLEMNAVSDESDKEFHFSVSLSNNTDRLSFFSRVLITKGERGEEVLPTFWDNNFIILFPGEKTTIHATVSKDDLAGKIPYVEIEGNKLIKALRAEVKK